jgi:hypothetical protein
MNKIHIIYEPGTVLVMDDEFKVYRPFNYDQGEDYQPLDQANQVDVIYAHFQAQFMEAECETLTE